MTCRHRKALGICDSNTWAKAGIPDPRNVKRVCRIDRWCPTCGSIRVWLSERRPTWVRVGEAEKLRGGR